LNTVKKSQDLSRNRPWLTFLVIVTLGTLMFLLPGCGSDSTPKGAASAKKAQPAKSPGDKGTQMITTLLSGKEGDAPPIPTLDKLPGNLTREQLESNIKATEQAMRDPKREVVPGLTLEQMEANIEAAKRASLDPKREVVPGLTLEQINANIMEAQKRSAPANVLSGFTEEQMKAKLAEAKQLQDAKGQRPEQAFPSAK
jgi:hypothetical protein